jgi:predicted nucleotidyltransferase
VVETAVVESIHHYLALLAEQGIPVLFGVVYGSQVNGTSHEWSDIDLLVVSRRFDQTRSREEWANLWFLASRVDPRIEPIPCGEIQWREDDSNLIIDVARKEGVVVRIGEQDDSSFATSPPDPLSECGEGGIKPREKG